MKKADNKTKSTVRHTRAIQADRQKRPLVDNLTAEVEALFHSLVHPLTLSQCELFRQMGFARTHPYSARHDGHVAERRLATNRGCQ